MKNVMLMCATLALGLVIGSPAFAAVGLKVPTTAAPTVEDNPGGKAFAPSSELPNVSCAPCSLAASASGLVAATKGETSVGLMRPPQTGQVTPTTPRTSDSVR